MCNKTDAKSAKTLRSQSKMKIRKPVPNRNRSGQTSLIRAHVSRQLSVAAMTGSAMALSVLYGNAPRAATLPVPCAAGSCAPNKTPGFTTQPGGFVTSGQATATQNGNTLTVNQSSSQAILNWSSFNISSDGKVVFQQPGASSVALNKIFQASPSTIFGQLTANGQIYLINPNGFVFGSSSSVNVAGLIASSMGFTKGDSAIANGFVPPTGQPVANAALTTDGRLYVTDASGNLVPDAQGNPQPVQIVVQPGAQMTATNGGRLMLAGQQVVNGGSLSAPDGQIVLGAGQSIYLAASSDPNLRGLIVEVSNSPDPSITSPPPVSQDDPAAKQLGTVTNQAGAALSSPRGNVSLVGLAVNQSGRISATTAVSANGSVILTAANGGAQGAGAGCQGTEAVCATVGGTLKIGSSSEIDVLPDLTDTTTAVVGQTQNQSQVALTGQQINIEGGQIVAPAGNLSVVAAADPDRGLATHGNSAAQIRVASGTNIDLSGSTAVLPMSANLLSIQLRSNELADDPVQRGGPLEAQTVIVDTRDGRPPIISETSWLSALQGISENILQRTALGGTASFMSEGDVVVANGATINVSGGKWTYQPGVTQTSQLVGANGKLYDIGTADPSFSYTGVINPTFTQSFNGFGVQITQATPGLGHYQSGYSEGFSAGQVTFAAPSMALQGSLIGTAVNGPYQRTAANIPAESLIGYMAGKDLIPGTIAKGGTLIIGDPTPVSTGVLPDYFSPAVTFTNNPAPVVVAEGAPLTSGTLELSPTYITSGGFQQTQIYSDSTFALPTGLPLFLGAGGSLAVQAGHISIGSNIEAPGGIIDLESGDTVITAASGVIRTGIEIASGVTLDVRGQWTNNSIYAPGSSAIAPAYQDGGKITLALWNANSLNTAGGKLTIGDNVGFEASGGAWIEANNTIVGGKGGTITLDASPYNSGLQLGNNVSLDAFGVQGALGGKFSLSAPRIAVGNGGVWAAAQAVDDLAEPGDLAKPGNVFTVGSALFSQDGFSAITLNATAPVLKDATSNDTLTVNTGTSISAQAQSWQLNPGYTTRGSGGDVSGFVRAASLPAVDQNPFSLILQTTAGHTDPQATTLFGDLDIQTGASISLVANSKSNLSLISEGSLLVDGTLRVPGGNIAATINPPESLTDPGYLPDQRLELGSHATVDVTGTTLYTPNVQNLPLGTVLPGGKIALTALRGDVIADLGSSMDFGGSSAVLDVKTTGGAGGYTTATVGSAGGSLVVQSVESASLLGTLSGAAGASSVGSLAGGVLEVDLTPSVFVQGKNATAGVQNALPNAPSTIELVANAAGSTPTASYGNLAVLGVAQLEQSGIDTLNLRSENTIELASNTALSLGEQISLDAPNIAVSYGTSASLIAPYVSLANHTTAVRPAPLGGTGALSVTAQQITLSGAVGLQGVANATLTSYGDVELEPGYVDATHFDSSLSLSGNLTINAARVYPATQTPFTINDPNGNVVIGQTTASPGTPLSVAGSLTINAANITSSGTLLAPFGTISLNATDSLSLLSGSLTSVSGAGMVLPYGQTILGQSQWVYTSAIPVNAVPDRQISLTAPSVSFASGATIDLSGGGNLTAYEWVPGTGGYVDSLAPSNAAANNLYAILPSTRGQYAAFDVQEFATAAEVNGGTSVYLSGIPGLAAGYYPLLPARYALLPGAYLVQAEPSYTSLTPGQIGALPDGTPVIAGYTGFGTTGLQTSTGYTGFAVRPGSYAQSLANYHISDAATYFAAAAASAGKSNVTLPADAGTLLIAAGSSLSAAGRLNSAAGAGGAAATVEISANDITVTGSTSLTGAGGVSIAASVLQSWNVGDLILGGQLTSDGSLNVSADTVTFGQGAQFSAGQVLAVADNSIEVQSGAVVSSTSGQSGTAPKSLPQATALNLVHQDPTQTIPQLVADDSAALLAVSDMSLPVVTRATAASSSAGSSPAATVQIDSGATLSTRGALAVDAPGTVNIAGTLNAPGANWSLASTSIAVVGANQSSSDSLVINPNLLSQMQSAGGLWLTSAGNIDLMTPITFGVSGTQATLGSLSLTAAAINNLSGGAEVLGAQTLTLQGNGANAPTPTATGATAGTLTLVANNLNIGFAPGADGTNSLPTYTGNLAINGNSQTTLQVAQALTGEGYLTASSSNTSSSTSSNASSANATNALGIAGSVTISAAELTAASHSDTSILLPDGVLTIQQQGKAADPSTLASSLGGKLSLAASQIQDSGSIIVPGGRISLQTTQNPTSTPGSVPLTPSITLASGAVVDVGGISVSAGNQTIGAAGGIVNISSAGDLSLADGAKINVSGAGHSPAGFLSLTGAGTVSLAGTLTGNAASDATGGSFWLDAGQLQGGLPGLAGNLTSGGFTNQINVRVRSGDLDSAAGTTLTANQITLTADNGVIDVAGTLNAPSAGTRGSIGLFAANGITLEGTGQLLANGTGLTGRGGEIELSTVSGSIALDTGSVIAATGQQQNGSLLLRAPALVSAGDVAIADINSNVNVGQVTIEPVLPAYQSAADFTQDFSQIQSDVQTYLGQANSVLPARFGGSIGAAPVVIEPGVVIDAPGDLTLSQALDLYSLALGAPIDLTVRSSGSLTINGMISDGLLNGKTVPAAPTPTPGTTLPPYVTSTLRFVAGADLNSANPLATVAGGNANLTLNSVVTTGTGDIDLVAANDVMVNPGGGAYTTGAAGSPSVKLRLGGTQVPINFLTGGGNVEVVAGRDVIGADGISASGVTSWQVHNVKGSLGYWGVNLSALNQNPWTFATLGGGDLSITAGRDINNVEAATADSMALVGSTQTHFSSGSMVVDAGRDIASGQFFVANGTGTLNAGRSFASNLSYSSGGAGDKPQPVGSLFELEDAQLSLWAQDGIAIEGVIDPTLQHQPSAAGTLSDLVFFTYGGSSSFSAQSSSGDVSLSGNVNHIAVLAGAAQGQDQVGWNVLPPSVRLVSLMQDLDAPSGTLFPSASGQLQLFAGKDIVGGTFVMSDAPAQDIQTPTNYSSVDGISNIVASVGLAQDDFNADLHANDSRPASIVAGRDIDSLNIVIPKAADVVAGRDIINLQYVGQNLSGTDLTLISAGRDFVDAPQLATSGLVNTNVASVVSLGGPGQLDILAGRNIDLGFGVGVTTDGSLRNPNLPTANGAGITMLAGLGQGADYAGFLTKIIEPSSSYQQQLVSYVESLNGQTDLTVSQADTDFAALTADEQRAFVDGVFFNELNLSGIEANKKPGAGYSRGYAAIDALFPGSRSGNNPYNGDLNLTYSEIYTLSGGSISLLVPGGEINVGLAAPPGGSNVAKDPSQLGIVAQGSGDVSIYSLGDVNVNSSRVFTLGGGNILIWSDKGNIDAGNGAKTSLSLPPPSYKPDKFGNPQLVFNAAVAGSGIRTIQEGPGVPAGNVNLIAPVGAVNAGDAGIGAAGNINLSALVVTGASNINFGGAATGVPPAVANITASVSGAASAAGATANTAAGVENLGNKQDENATASQAAISWLDVFVTGLGDENCKPEDQECIERQKHP
jgi:filamentous hemagglutinin family protein